MIRYAALEDEKQILALMELVKDDFAGYNEGDFLKAVHQAIKRQEALLEETDGKMAGMLLFSRDEKELAFLAVHPDARKRGTAKRLIAKMTEFFSRGDIVYVVTFREGDPKGIAARACYHACGFVDGEELTVFNYPCQKLILRL